jgi:glycosyltransferase involved in cell wall biosynthesis
MLPHELRGIPSVIVDSKSHEELLRLYPECHYGFILREDIIVNRVACPTKLVEYIAMGIIPIVDCEDIGDFKSLGMQFVRLRDFMAGQLPDEEARSRMAEANFVVYERLRELRRIGSETLLAAIAIRRSRTKEFADRSKIYAKKYYPMNSDRGRIARRLLQIARRNSTLPNIVSDNKGTKTVAPTSYPVEQIISPAIPKCDVLVQVDNFLSGGLENVVLDLNETLIQSGLQVVLLVQGEAGVAVERAKRKGMAVHISRFAPDSYAELLSKALPKLIFSHYSIKGASICAKMNIPLVQIIHNTYMWFSEEEAADFAVAARYTTIFVAVSDFVKNYSVQRLGVPDEKCLVIPNGIDLDKFRNLDVAATSNSLRPKFGLLDDDFVFLSVGAVNHQKNHLGTIKAFCSVMPVCPKAKLVILGPLYEQQLFDNMQKYIFEHELGSQIIYAGTSTNPQDYYAMADAFVSAAFFEGGQLSLLEAVAANLPIITAEIGFATHFKDRKGFAVIPPPLDVFSYCGRIWELQSSPEFERELAAKMVKTYRERVRPDFSEEMLNQFDKNKSYQLYLHLVRQIAEGSEVSMSRLMNTWPNSLAMAG